MLTVLRLPLSKLTQDFNPLEENVCPALCIMNQKHQEALFIKKSCPMSFARKDAHYQKEHGC